MLKTRNVGSWVQSCVAIAFIKTEPMWQQIMMDLIPGCDIVINFSSEVWLFLSSYNFLNFQAILD